MIRPAPRIASSQGNAEEMFMSEIELWGIEALGSTGKSWTLNVSVVFW
jgi:hypothetical protein